MRQTETTAELAKAQQMFAGIEGIGERLTEAKQHYWNDWRRKEAKLDELQESLARCEARAMQHDAASQHEAASAWRRAARNYQAAAANCVTYSSSATIEIFFETMSDIADDIESITQDALNCIANGCRGEIYSDGESVTELLRDLANRAEKELDAVHWIGNWGMAHDQGTCANCKSCQSRTSQEEFCVPAYYADDLTALHRDTLWLSDVFCRIGRMSEN